MRRLLAVLSLVLTAVGGPTGAQNVPEPPDLPEMPVSTYAEIHHDKTVLTVDLRAEKAIGAAMFELARRPEAFSDIPNGCLAVLIIDDTVSRQDVADAVSLFGDRGCTVFRLAGNAADWVAARLAGKAKPRKRRGPGDVPFIVPRGLCERLDPAQVFN